MGSELSGLGCKLVLSPALPGQPLNLRQRIQPAREGFPALQGWLSMLLNTVCPCRHQSCYLYPPIAGLALLKQL